MTSPAAEERSVLVIGAGIVGVCAALYLQRQGFKVTLIDRDDPGQAASFGNSGSFGTASVPPLGLPGTLAKVPKMLFDPLHALVVRWRYLPRSWRWFLHFSLASRRPWVEAIAEARHRLLARTYEAFDPLLRDAGAWDLIQRVGRLEIYGSEASFAANRYAFELRRRHGVPMRELTGDEMREMEPDLGPGAVRGMLFPGVSHTVSPLRLTQALAESFVGGGGTLLRETVTGFDIGSDGPRRVLTDAGGHEADLVVVAAGVWSRELARQLGTRVLLESERGYHSVVPEPGVKLKLAIAASDHNVSITPMEDGLRLATMAEFCGVDGRPDYARAERIYRTAKAILPGLRFEGGSRWHGPRPSTPDSLPVIGRAPRHPSVLFAFGHGHLGLTMAAVTGQLIADLALGRQPDIDLAPYRPDRFE
jgi:D-amino-acid dehydrogenase